MKKTGHHTPVRVLHLNLHCRKFTLENSLVPPRRFSDIFKFSKLCVNYIKHMRNRTPIMLCDSVNAFIFIFCLMIFVTLSANKELLLLLLRCAFLMSTCLWNSSYISSVERLFRHFMFNKGCQLVMSNSWYPEALFLTILFVVYKIIFNCEHSDVREGRRNGGFCKWRDKRM